MVRKGANARKRARAGEGQGTSRPARPAIWARDTSTTSAAPGPTTPGGKGLRLGVDGEGGESPPGRVAALELHQTRAQHQPEEQEAQQPEGDRRRLGLPPRPRKHAWRGQEEGQEACFEEQAVPL